MGPWDRDLKSPSSDCCVSEMVAGLPLLLATLFSTLRRLNVRHPRDVTRHQQELPLAHSRSSLAEVLRHFAGSRNGFSHLLPPTQRHCHNRKQEDRKHECSKGISSPRFGALGLCEISHACCRPACLSPNVLESIP